MNLEPACLPAQNLRGLRGHLRLNCALDCRGVSILREQSFQAPVHLSKPHWDAGFLVVNVVNPTAGLLEGDRIHQDVRVERGASLLLTSPSASRAHKVRDGWAEVIQEFDVAQDGFLEVLPELFIPQAGARYKQSTTIRVAEGGSLIQTETIAPGRVASGEAFQYQSLDWRTDLFTSGRLAAKERLRMQPGSPQITALTRHFPRAYYASILAVGPFLLNFIECEEEWNALQSEESWVGASPTADPRAWSFRIVSQTSHSLRYTAEAVRGLLYRKAGRELASTRRVAGR